MCFDWKKWYYKNEKPQLFEKKIPNFVSNSNERGDKYNNYYDCDDDLDFNTPHSLVDHEEMNTLEETSIHERPKRLWNPNPRYNDYVLY